MVRLDLNLNEFVTIEDVHLKRKFCQLETKSIINVLKGVRKNIVQYYEFVTIEDVRIKRITRPNWAR